MDEDPSTAPSEPKYKTRSFVTFKGEKALVVANTDSAPFVYDLVIQGLPLGEQPYVVGNEISFKGTRGKVSKIQGKLRPVYDVMFEDVPEGDIAGTHEGTEDPSGGKKRRKTKKSKSRSRRTKKRVV